MRGFSQEETIKREIDSTIKRAVDEFDVTTHELIGILDTIKTEILGARMIRTHQRGEGNKKQLGHGR